MVPDFHDSASLSRRGEGMWRGHKTENKPRRSQDDARKRKEQGSQKGTDTDVSC